MEIEIEFNWSYSRGGAGIVVFGRGATTVFLKLKYRAPSSCPKAGDAHYHTTAVADAPTVAVTAASSWVECENTRALC